MPASLSLVMSPSARVSALRTTTCASQSSRRGLGAECDGEGRHLTRGEYPVGSAPEQFTATIELRQQVGIFAQLEFALGDHGRYLAGASQPERRGDPAQALDSFAAPEPRDELPFVVASVAVADPVLRFLEHLGDDLDDPGHGRPAHEALLGRMLRAAELLFHQHPHLIEPAFSAEEELADGIVERRTLDARSRIDVFSIALLLCDQIQSERRQSPLGSQPGRSCLESGRGAVAAPGVLLRSLDHSGPYGIESDVLDQRQQIALLLDEEAFEAALKEVTAALILPVEPLGVLAVHPLHAPGERGLGCLEDEMEVIGHEGVGMDDPAEAPDGLDEDGEEHEVILVAAVDVLAIVAA